MKRYLLDTLLAGLGLAGILVLMPLLWPLLSSLSLPDLGLDTILMHGTDVTVGRLLIAVLTIVIAYAGVFAVRR